MNYIQFHNPDIFTVIKTGDMIKHRRNFFHYDHHNETQKKSILRKYSVCLKPIFHPYGGNWAIKITDQSDSRTEMIYANNKNIDQFYFHESVVYRYQASIQDQQSNNLPEEDNDPFNFSVD